MTSMDIFGLVLFIIVLVLAIVFFAGKGEGVLYAFDRTREPSNRSEEEERKYQRVIAFFLLGLAGSDLFMTVLGRINRIFTIVGIGLIILDIVIYGVYMKKHFPDDRR